MRAQRAGSLRRGSQMKCRERSDPSFTSPSCVQFSRLRDREESETEIDTAQSTRSGQEMQKTTTKNACRKQKTARARPHGLRHTGHTHAGAPAPSPAPPLRTRREPGSHNAQAQRTRVGPLIARGETRPRAAAGPQLTMQRAPCTMHHAPCITRHITR